MNKIIRNARLLNNKRIDIIYNDEQIIKLGNNLECQSCEEVILPPNSYLSAGWIDMHTHCFEGFDLYEANADTIGIRTGVTTIVDAGTTGFNHIDQFYNDTLTSKTRVYAFINISELGIERQNELSDMNFVNKESVIKKINQYPEFIVGIKARMSQSVVGENDVEPLKIAKKAGRSLNKPVMVHIGSNPPKLKDIVTLLEKDDIITHVYNGKANGILDNDNKVLDFMWKAKNDGIILDLGHGTDSFNFEVGEQAIAQSFTLDTISTDIYSRNMEKGPVYDLATTMNKMLFLGYEKERVLAMVTTKPAQVLNLKHQGDLEVGNYPDFTIFKYHEINQSLFDSNGNERKQCQGFETLGCIVKGEYYGTQK
ncbi:amidohydrolase/deacetylase family metallohydrolase [Erysipelothrix urinaevulpis]|uniref:amidohydrolase/deacetylase family metallohydrolase n=1 Tax=Erysipelothrix urinaevulpis TaxID=2683717 RepID=UPI00135CE9AE|nr:amidohydrolase/deacetylase family metallohydrolase [Erysipelothrix urinaevulpis]